ncbi:MAG: tyrosine--tRNA ligase [Yaniella sp.]|uniref:tyrosine--tRNA ligase n=1 Tax=Yaniella sp. TaxID=2773929 RepID=UPI003F9BC508
MISVNNEEFLSRQTNDPSFENIWQEMQWRGLIQVSTDEAKLEEALSGDPINYYCGFDPTAASLHLGHLVQLLVLRRLQLAGHHPVALVGGATGLIGDPRQTSERSLNTRDTVEGWVDSLRSQIEHYLSFDGDNGATMVNNLDWTGGLSALDFLRDIGKHFRVGTMVRKEIVASRLDSDEGISYTEFSYQVLQGMDFMELYRRHNVTLQTGGSDQWGNLTSGTELVRKVEGEHVHAIGTPLITNADGTKFGKSEGNAIWLNPEMCSPYTFYQFWLNTADADVVERLKVFTFLSRAEIAEYEQKVVDEPFRREAQRRLAWEVTSLVHGEDQTQRAIDASAALFGRGDLESIDVTTLHAAGAELPSAEQSDLGERMTIIDLLVATGLEKSKSSARRTVGDGGAYLNNTKIEDPEHIFTATDALHNKYFVVRRGRRNLGFIDLDSASN